MENPGLSLTPFQRRYLLKSLETDLRVEYRHRIEIMLLFDAGESQAQICEALGCSQDDCTLLDYDRTNRTSSQMERSQLFVRYFFKIGLLPIFRELPF
jgi:hypothetical protein